MKVLNFDEKNFLKRLQIMKPKYLFMNENTLILIEKDWNGPYENIPYDFSFQGRLNGVPVILEKDIPVGEVIFGVE